MPGIQQSYYKLATHAYSQHDKDGRRLLCAGRDVALYTDDWVRTYYTHSKYSHLEAFQTSFFILLGENMERWQPKPSVCFTRKDHGTIMTVGNEIIQFDREMKVIQRTTAVTFFAALQRTLMLVGGLT